MKVNILANKRTVPFKMIVLGKCFLLNGTPCMRINSTGLDADSGLCVNLETGNTYGCHYDHEVVPMIAECTLVEERMEDDV